jgi:hypothetical protein
MYAFYLSNDSKRVAFLSMEKTAGGTNERLLQPNFAAPDFSGALQINLWKTRIRTDRKRTLTHKN